MVTGMSRGAKRARRTGRVAPPSACEGSPERFLDRALPRFFDDEDHIEGEWIGRAFLARDEVGIDAQGPGADGVHAQEVSFDTLSGLPAAEHGGAIDERVSASRRNTSSGWPRRSIWSGTSSPV